MSGGMAVFARLPADADRADRDRLPVRAQDHRLAFRGGYTLGQRLRRQRHAGRDDRSGRAGDADAVARVPLEVASAQRRRSPPGCRRCSTIPATSPARSPPPSPRKRRPWRRPDAEKKQPPPEPAPESKAAAGTAIALDQPRSASAGERALLERLQERRQELDARARELDLRESMLKAAEKKLEIQTAVGKAEEAKGGTGRIAGWAGGPAQGRDRERTLQERRHHVRDHEAEGGRQDLRPPRHQGADRGGEPDQAASACPRSWRR